MGMQPLTFKKSIETTALNQAPSSRALIVRPSMHVARVLPDFRLLHLLVTTPAFARGCPPPCPKPCPPPCEPIVSLTERIKAITNEKLIRK